MDDHPIYFFIIFYKIYHFKDKYEIKGENNMFNFLQAQTIDKDKIAELLKTTPAALEKFEKAYKLQALSDNEWKLKR